MAMKAEAFCVVASTNWPLALPTFAVGRPLAWA